MKAQIGGLASSKKSASSESDLLQMGEAFGDRIPESMRSLSALYIGLDCMLAVLGYLEIRVAASAGSRALQRKP
eukprot:g5771.t1